MEGVCATELDGVLYDTYTDVVIVPVVNFKAAECSSLHQLVTFSTEVREEQSLLLV